MELSLKKYKPLLLDKASPMQDLELDQLKSKIFSGAVSLPYVTNDQFCSRMNYWLHNDTVNNLSGLENFVQEACVGVTGFIDNLIMKYGLDNLQIFEHDYTYYKRLNPSKEWAKLGSLDPRRPLLIALPFPGHGDIHYNMQDILDECLEKNIPVYIDSAWMSSASGIEFNFDHPAIQSVGFSLSKGLSLGWNRIGMRYSRSIDPTDAITIGNTFGIVNEIDLSVGMLYMEHFSQSYLWKKYGKLYHQACKEFLLRPTKCIHMVKHFNTGKPYGIRDVLLAAIEDQKNQ